MTQHNKELFEGVLRYTRNLSMEGRIERLRELGIDSHQAEKLNELSLQEFEHLTRLGGNFMNISINPADFDRAYHRAKQCAQTDKAQDTFLRRHAPSSMMRQLFGLTDKEVVKRRHYLDVHGRQGRPRWPTDPELMAVHSLWHELAHVPGYQDEWGRYLKISEETGLDMDVLWAAAHTTEYRKQLAESFSLQAEVARRTGKRCGLAVQPRPRVLKMPDPHDPGDGVTP